ncbi:hypothetical protein RKD20_004337 [Streptomyces sp. SLBN-8D4]
MTLATSSATRSSRRVSAPGASRQRSRVPTHTVSLPSGIEYTARIPAAVASSANTGQRPASRPDVRSVANTAAPVAAAAAQGPSPNVAWMSDS